ncbi:2-dehydro-3-deoxygluconate kinase [Caenispirillum salinarum AK4]|uniref:2-dehydro-3-deoxygluconate kinase n=1 Tax=Caenispirillum salinarum AK4 TaxID=1238182 RepID=K9GV54_9PROT|nr:sugar kinase [Caenispirillum salinarum]EKV28594.1 2-dehydro-3-deoxygluconate kinase [Caenispirillum salinarum AK4]
MQDGPIVSLGEGLMELNQTRGSDQSYMPGFGGDTSNTAVAAARQGSKAAFISAVGADTFGDDMLAMWRREGVDTTHVRQVADAPTGIYFVSHGEEGHRFAYYRAGSAASRMTPADLPLDAIRSAGIFHCSAISQAISASACDSVFAALEAAREAGVATSYDTNLRLKLWPLARARAIIAGTVPYADILLPGLDDARLLTGLDDADAVVDLYLEQGVKVIALTMGHEGVLVATPDARRRIPPHRVEAVDATGAGDAFDGCFLARLQLGDDPFAAAEYANTAAALSTTGYGAVAPIPRAEDVRKAMPA